MDLVLPREAELINASNDFLIEECTTAGALRRAKLYTELTYRLAENPDLEQYILNAIIEERNRREIFFGFIKVAWIPIIVILSLQNSKLEEKLHSALKKNWTESERKNLIDYVKKEFDLSGIL